MVEAGPLGTRVGSCLAPEGAVTFTAHFSFSFHPFLIFTIKELLPYLSDCKSLFFSSSDVVDNVKL